MIQRLFNKLLKKNELTKWHKKGEHLYFETLFLKRSLLFRAEILKTKNLYRYVFLIEVNANKSMLKWCPHHCEDKYLLIKNDSPQFYNTAEEAKQACEAAIKETFKE